MSKDDHNSSDNIVYAIKIFKQYFSCLGSIVNSHSLLTMMRLEDWITCMWLEEVYQVLIHVNMFPKSLYSRRCLIEN